MRAQRSTPFIVNAVVFALLEIAAFALMKSTAPLQEIWLSKASHEVQRVLWGWTRGLSEFVSLSERNAALQEENARLMGELERRAEAGSLEGGPGAERGFVFLPARVEMMKRGSNSNYIVLNRGSEGGVEPGCGIVCARGVVGIVESVSSGHSYGITLMNSGVSVSARAGRKGNVCSLVWDGVSSRGGRLEGIPVQVEVEPGDTVYTSGYSSVFPPDFPLGITGSTSRKGGATSTVEVDLFADFSALGPVLIVKNLERAEIEELTR